MTTPLAPEVESIEAMAKEIDRRERAHDDDAEADLQELIREFVHVTREPLVDEEFAGEDEFACRACHMILHRSRLADPAKLVCNDCASRDVAVR